jgi:hypothetical protein
MRAREREQERQRDRERENERESASEREIARLEPVQVEKWLAFRDSCCLHLHFPPRYLRPRPYSSSTVWWAEQMSRRYSMHARFPTQTPRGTACPGCFRGTPTLKCEREQRRNCKKK